MALPHSINAISNANSGRLDTGGLREVALAALTVAFGLQLLRILLSELVFYVRDSLGASPAVPGAYAAIVFLLAFLVPWTYRRLGTTGSSAASAGGLGILRLLEQLILAPAADLALATLGTVLFLIFIPIQVSRLRKYGARGSHLLVAGLLLGVSLDTVIKGAFSTLDTSWQPGAAAHGMVIFLVVCQSVLLWTVVRGGASSTTGHPGYGRMAPMIAVGPILFLEALLFQNIGQQTVLIGWSQPVVIAWITGANAVGLAAALCVVARPSQGRWLTIAALGGLLTLLASGERAGRGAAMAVLLGQVAVSMALGMTGLALMSSKGSAGIGSTAVASGLGMLSFLVLAFLYYSNYQFDIPGGPGVVPLIGVAIILACVLASIRSLHSPTATALSWAPI